jgi:hypothetical protein
MNGKNTCHTYLRVITSYDKEKYTEYLKKRNFNFAPEDIGVFNKDEMEKALKSFTKNVEWKNYEFIVEDNDKYNVDINEMIRATIKPFVGREEEVKTLKEKYGLEILLTIVPEIYADNEEVRPLLSLDDDIIAFLYNTNISHDLDYYIY